MLRAVTQFLLEHLVEMIMFAVGLRTALPTFLAEVRRPTLLVRELAVVAIGVPALALLVVRMLPVPPWSAVVAMLFAISPTAPFLLRSFQGRRTSADKALAVVTVALASSVIVVPIWLVILNRVFGFVLRVSTTDILGMLALKVFVPLFVGTALRRFAPRFARGLEHVVTSAIVISFVVVACLMLYLGSSSLRLVTLPVLVAVALIAVGSALIGELAGGEDLELREIFGRVALNGNPALALLIIGASYPDVEVDMGGLIAAYLVLRTIASTPYAYLSRRRVARHDRAEHASISRSSTCAEEP